MAALKEKPTNTTRAAKAGDKASKPRTNTSPNTSRKRKSNAESDKENNAPVTDSNPPAKKRTKKSQDVEIAATPEPSPEPAKEKTTPKSTTPAKKARKTATTPKSSAKANTKPSNKPSKSPATTASSSSTSAASKKQSEEDKYDISDIHLDGESSGNVPVYDTCADLRTKINAHLRSKTIPRKHSTQVSLLRNFADSFPKDVPPPEGLSSRSLKTYLAKKGQADGISMPIHYAAYVYFEKLRIKLNKKKSKKREEMEEHWGKNGMDVSAGNDTRTQMFFAPNEYVDVNKYGRMEIVRG